MSDDIQNRPDRLALLWTEAAVIKAGDTVLIRYDTAKPMPKYLADEIKGFLETKLPDVNVVVVQADEFVVYRPEDHT